jgi:hypothetical protein
VAQREFSLCLRDVAVLSFWCCNDDFRFFKFLFSDMLHHFLSVFHHFHYVVISLLYVLIAFFVMLC